MRMVAGLAGVVVMVILAMLGWNWWSSQNSQLTMTYPTDGAVLAGNTVPVRIAANSELQDKLNKNNAQIVTYLNGKEVSRGHDLNYTLGSVPPGEYKIEVGLNNQADKNSISMNMLSKPVNFTLGGGSGANQNPTDGSIYSAPPVASTTDGSATTNTDAAPAPSGSSAPAAPKADQAPVQLPASGLGGGSLQSIAALPQPQTAAQPAQIIDGTGAAVKLASNRISGEAIAAAQDAAQAQAENGSALPFFRWLGAFYMAGFVVGLALVVGLFVQHRRRQ